MPPEREHAGLDCGLELFTCADSLGQSQLNAWNSWKQIPNCSVSVFGDAPGVSDSAIRLGFRSLPAVKRNESGRPLLSWIFERMHEESSSAVLAYMNSDIVLLPGLAESIAAVRARFDAYLMVARRWNIEHLPPIDFGPGWDDELRNRVTREGKLFTPYGIDLFVFNRGLLRGIPPFALGCDYWDNHLIMRTRRSGVPVIDVTPQVMLVHQNHPLGKYRSEDERRRGPEGLRAFSLAGDSYAMLGRTTDATHVMAGGQLEPAETAHITAVLPHLGDTQRLCRCLRSLEYQTYPQSYLNAVVVNSDLNAPLRYLEADFPSLRVVNEASPGAAAARNKGVSCAAGEMVALFHADLIPATHCLERALRAGKRQPDCQLLACRIDPLFASGERSYFERAVEWFDAATYYNSKDWVTETGAWITGALIVSKEVFARCGYFDDFCREAPAAEREWLRRVVASGVKVAFCRDAVVTRETVKSNAEMRRKQERHARGDCLVQTFENGEAPAVGDVLRTEWRQLCSQIRNVWTHRRIPSRYRAGVLFFCMTSFLWTLREKLRYRKQAARILRRRRQVMNRTAQPGPHAGTRGTGAPVRWLAARIASRRAQRRGGANYQ